MFGPVGKKDPERAAAAVRRKALKELTRFTLARRLETPRDRLRFDIIGAGLLRPGDVILVLAEDVVPADGEVLDGAARLDESAIVGPGEPALRSTASGHSHVAAGSRLLAGWLVLGVTAPPQACLLRRLVDGNAE